jgi:hypothetical protein
MNILNIMLLKMEGGIRECDIFVNDEVNSLFNLFC